MTRRKTNRRTHRQLSGRISSTIFSGPLIKKPEEEILHVEEQGSFSVLLQSQLNGLVCVTVPLSPDPALNRLNLQQQT